MGAKNKSFLYLLLWAAPNIKTLATVSGLTQITQDTSQKHSVSFHPTFSLHNRKLLFDFEYDLLMTTEKADGSDEPECGVQPWFMAEVLLHLWYCGKYHWVVLLRYSNINYQWIYHNHIYIWVCWTFLFHRSNLFSQNVTMTVPVERRQQIFVQKVWNTLCVVLK